jgi:tripartite-type tricarboxylate transporter receptor subunit TctC
MAPAGTPRDIIDRLNTEAAKIMQTAETRERFLAVGGEPATSTPEQTAEFLRGEYARWSRVIKDAAIRAE